MNITKPFKSLATAVIPLILLVSQSRAQSGPVIPAAGVEITKAIPASPDAAALGKYGSIPVSPYTGVPNISIPLYTIQSGGISLPISLSYHAGGNKVEELASSVGLGWALNAGGTIVRTIRGGLADEQSLGFLDGGHFVPNILNTIHGTGTLSSDSLNTYLNRIADGSMDGEADMYNFNFGNYSGRFVMDNYGNVTTIPLQNIKFAFTVGSGPDGYPMIMSFTAITPDGITYVFGSDSDGDNAVETTSTLPSCSMMTQKPRYYATSWFIKRITDPLGHEIDFTYTTENYNIVQNRTDTRYQFYSRTKVDAPLTTPPESVCNVTNGVKGVKLSSIVFENGEVDFHASPRNDVSNANLIDSVLVHGGGLNKGFRLFYTNVSGQRLRLDSLRAYLPGTTDVPGSFKEEKYSFTYNPDSWQSYTSYSQDYWGYNNGVGNTTLLPPVIFTPYGSSTPVYIPGADRSSHESAMEGGILNRITYPTGGYTLFTYEGNRSITMPGGYSSNNLGPVNYTAKSSNPDDHQFYNYDNLHDNPSDLVNVFFPDATLVPMNMFSSGLRTNDCNTDCIWATLNQLDGTGQIIATYPFKSNIDTVVYVPPGSYQLVVTDAKNQAYDPTSNPSGVKYTAGVSWQNEDTLTYYKNYVVGGLRIKQIADYDGINPGPINLRTYQYTLPGQSASSGWIDFQPVYSYYLGINGGDIYHGIYTNTFLVQTAVSNYPLATTQGSVVGYSHVTEFEGDANGRNGKTEYFYTNSQTDPDIQSQVPLNTGFVADNGFPFAPPMSHDWRRGLLTEQITYRAAGAGFAKVQDKVNGYTPLYGAFMNNIKAGFNVTAADYNEMAHYFDNTYPDGAIDIVNYTDYTDFSYLSSETTTDYSLTDPTKTLQTTVNYQMDPATLQIANITTTNSKNEKIIQSVTWPPAYSTAGITGSASMRGLSNLQSHGIISYPVEEITQKSNADGSNLRTIKAVLTTYKPTMAVRDSVYAMRSTAPVTGFMASSSGTANIIKDIHYQPVVTFTNYDNYGNILQEKKVNDATHSYIWGYATGNPQHDSYPIAGVINSGLINNAYSNFESYDVSGYGNWTYSSTAVSQDATAPMGPGYFTVSGANTISKTGLLTTSAYTVSFWSKTGAAVTVTGGTVTAAATGSPKSGWTYREYKVTGTTTITIGGSGAIDELRLYVSGGLMTTYTYAPLAGITAKCDTRNNITYYNYDNVGRLSSVMDQNRNYLKDYLYNYVAQGAVWTDMGIKQCVTGPNGNTGEELKEQQDANPYSLTYKQTRWLSLGQQTGDCPVPPPPVYVKIRVTGASTANVNGYAQTYNTFEADAFSDAACTTRLNVTADLTVYYYLATTTVYSNGDPTGNTSNIYPVVIHAGGSAGVIGSIDVSGCAPYSGGYTACSTATVTLAGGIPGYTPEY